MIRARIAAVGVALAVVPAAIIAAPAPTHLAMRSKPAHEGMVDDLDCSACHTSSSWQLAPTAGAAGFDHDRTGFALRGVHEIGRAHV